MALCEANRKFSAAFRLWFCVFDFLFYFFFFAQHATDKTMSLERNKRKRVNTRLPGSVCLSVYPLPVSLPVCLSVCSTASPAISGQENAPKIFRKWLSDHVAVPAIIQTASSTHSSLSLSLSYPFTPLSHCLVGFVGCGRCAVRAASWRTVVGVCGLRHSEVACANNGQTTRHDNVHTP